MVKIRIADAFNRTSLELKRAIPPKRSPAHDPFNRTSLELKLVQISFGSRSWELLLIEPVWN